MARVLKEVLRTIALRILPPSLIFVALIWTWESGVFHRLLDLKTYMVPYPTSILDSLTNHLDNFLEEVSISFFNALRGYLVGSGIGILFAILLAEVDSLRRYLLPTISGLSAMPILATAPLMMLYFGFGSTSAIAVVVLMTIPPTIISVYKGLTSLDKDSLDLLYSLAANRPMTIRKLKFPAALPYVFTSLKLNVTLSLVAVIVTEFISNQRGIGSMMTRNLENFNMPMAWTAMLMISVFGVLWFQIVQIIERFVVSWHISIRTD